MTDQQTEIDDIQEAFEETHPQEGVASENFSAPHCAHLAKLILKRNGAETDIEYPISGNAIIGRFDPSVGPIDVDLQPIPEGSYVSRKHARLTCEGDVWTLEDLGSSNGTYVLGEQDFERIEKVEIQDGQEISLGNARFLFRLTEHAVQE